MTEPANSDSQQAERSAGQFQPGQSGNPAGRAKGSRNRASVVLDALADGEAEAILKATIEQAKKGEPWAAQLILSRAWPVPKGRRVAVDLPVVQTPAEIVVALGHLVHLIAAGEITPDEAAAIAAILETKRRAIEIVEIEARLAALEAKQK